MLGRLHWLRRVCGSPVVPVNIYCSRSEPQVTPVTPQSSAGFPRSCISQACEASKPCAEQLLFPHQAAARGSELAGPAPPAQGLLRPPRGGGNTGCPLPRNKLRPRHRGQWLGWEGGPHQPGEPDPGQALALATALSVRNSSSSQNPSLPSPGLGGGPPQQPPGTRGPGPPSRLHPGPVAGSSTAVTGPHRPGRAHPLPAEALTATPGADGPGPDGETGPAGGGAPCRRGAPPLPAALGSAHPRACRERRSGDRPRTPGFVAALSSRRAPPPPLRLP